VLVLYPLSAFPVCLIGAWSADIGLVSRESAVNAINTLYAPMWWATAKVPALRHASEAVARAIEPLAPHGRW